LEARQSLVSSLLHLVRPIINLSYSYLHGYAYLEYISRLIKGYHYFCVWVHRALSLLVYRLAKVAEPRVSMVLIRCSACECTLFPNHVVAAGGDSPSILCSPPHVNRFLNCRTVVASVEISFAELYSLAASEVHKSRVSLSYSWLYFDHVIRMS
jgi:hypothetical protein